MNAILTGSQAYGKPTEDSDVDIAVLMSIDDLEALRLLADDAGSDVPELCSHSLKFGKLNLLVCTYIPTFDTWVQGTKELKDMAPVSRDEAISVLSSLRREAGIV